MKAGKRRRQGRRIDLDGLLVALEESQLVRRLQDPELAYMFKHVLTQESAYQSLLVKRRRKLHRQVAECYERFYADELDEYAALLAQHYAEAGDDAKTLEYAIRAGDRAAQTYANAEAIMHYDTALEAARRVEASGERLAHLYSRRGRTLELSGRYAEALANYEEMEALSRQRGDRAMELASLMARATIHGAPTAVYDVAQGLALAARALALAHELGDRPAEAKIYWNLLLLKGNVSGGLREAIQYGERSLAIARELNLREQMAFTLSNLTEAYIGIGEREQALAALAEARELWRELGNLPMLTDNLGTSVFFSFFAGDYAQALRQSDEAFALSQSIGSAWGQSYSRMLIGYVYLEYGQMDKAIATMEECIRLAEQAGFIYPQTTTRAMEGLAYGFLGDFRRAFELAALALAKAEEQAAVSRPGVMAILAHLHLLNGDLAEAEAAIEKSRAGFSLDELTEPGWLIVAIAEGEFMLAQGDYPRVVSLMDDFVARFHRLGIRQFLADALLLKGKALLAQGEIEGAYEALQEARAEAEAIHSRRILWEILFALSQIEAKREDVAGAEALRRQAREIIEVIADHAGSPELRASFLGRSDVAAVLRQPERRL